MITIAQLTRLPRKFSKYYDRQFLPLLEKTGISMRELHVLLFLANHPGQDTARDVTELRGLAKSQVSQAVEALMAEQGYQDLRTTMDPGMHWRVVEGCNGRRAEHEEMV